MEYAQHDPGNSEADGKTIRRAEERAEKALKSAASKESAKRSTSAFRTSTLHYGLQNSRCPSTLSSWRNQSERLPFTRSSSFPSRNGYCFACGKFGHSRRSECPQIQRSGSKGNLSGNR